MRLLIIVYTFIIPRSLQSCTESSKALRNDSGKLKILFLGHDSENHNAAFFMSILASQLSLEGIGFTYTSNPNDLNPANLANYDCVFGTYATSSSAETSKKASFKYLSYSGNYPMYK